MWPYTQVAAANLTANTAVAPAPQPLEVMIPLVEPLTEGYLRSCSILNKLVSAARSAAETSIYRSRAERANGKCERCKI